MNKLLLNIDKVIGQQIGNSPSYTGTVKERAKRRAIGCIYLVALLAVSIAMLRG